MRSLVTVVLACLFLVAPSADMLCRASCQPAAAAPASCHEMSGDAQRDRIVPTASCPRDVLLAARVADARRDLVSHPLQAATPVAAPTVGGRVEVQRLRDWPVRPRATQACPPCIVLRV